MHFVRESFCFCNHIEKIGYIVSLMHDLLTFLIILVYEFSHAMSRVVTYFHSWHDSLTFLIILVYEFSHATSFTDSEHLFEMLPPLPFPSH